MREFDPKALIDAMAPLLGLDIAPGDRPGVAANLRILAAMAAVALEVPPDDRDEPAPVFTPGAAT